MLSILLLSVIMQSDGSESNEPILEGKVSNWSGDPMPNITVKVEIGDTFYGQLLTDSEGMFRFYHLSTGINYNITVFSLWTTNYTTNITLLPDQTNYLSLTVEPLDVGGLEGIIRLESNDPGYEVGVYVYPMGGATEFDLAGPEGKFSVGVIPSGPCDILFQKNGYDDLWVREFIVEPGIWNSIRVTMNVTLFFATVSMDIDDGKVQLDPSIQIEFSRDLGQDSIDEESVRINNKDTGKIIHYVLTINDMRTITMVPELQLEYGTEYVIEITSNVLDSLDNPFPGPYRFYFTTVEQVIEKGVLMTDPKPGDISIPVDTNITVYMPAPVDPSTITEGKFVIGKTDVPGTWEPGTLLLSGEMDVITFIPERDLAPMTSYTVTMSTDIGFEDYRMDFPGYEWSFFTEQETPTTGQISGLIYGIDKHYVSEYDPYVVITSNGMEKSQYIDDEGRFYFLDLEAGTWSVTVLAEGYLEWRKDVEVDSGRTTEMAPIFLEEEEDEEINTLILVTIIITVVLLCLIFITMMIIARVANEKKKEDERKTRGGSGLVRKGGIVSTQEIRHEIREGHKDRRMPSGIGASPMAINEETSEKRKSERPGNPEKTDDEDEEMIKRMMEMDEDDLIELVRDARSSDP